MAEIMEPGTAWFYIESGPTSTEMVREAFDMEFLNCVTQIVEEEGSYWVFVDMGRSCLLLEKAIEKLQKDELIIHGWKIKEHKFTKNG